MRMCKSKMQHCGWSKLVASVIVLLLILNLGFTPLSAQNNSENDEEDDGYRTPDASREELDPLVLAVLIDKLNINGLDDPALLNILEYESLEEMLDAAGFDDPALLNILGYDSMEEMLASGKFSMDDFLTAAGLPIPARHGDSLFPDLGMGGPSLSPWDSQDQLGEDPSFHALSGGSYPDYLDQQANRNRRIGNFLSGVSAAAGVIALGSLGTTAGLSAPVSALLGATSLACTGMARLANHVANEQEAEAEQIRAEEAAETEARATAQEEAAEEEDEGDNGGQDNGEGVRPACECEGSCTCGDNGEQEDDKDTPAYCPITGPSYPDDDHDEDDVYYDPSVGGPDPAGPDDEYDDSERQAREWWETYRPDEIIVHPDLVTGDTGEFVDDRFWDVDPAEEDTYDDPEIPEFGLTFNALDSNLAARASDHAMSLAEDYFADRGVALTTVEMEALNIVIGRFVNDGFVEQAVRDIREVNEELGIPPLTVFGEMVAVNLILDDLSLLEIYMFDILDDATATAEYYTHMPSMPSAHILTVNSSGQSGVNISSNTGHSGVTNYSGYVESGTEIHLEAAEYVGSGDSRYTFERWAGAVESTNRSITFTLDDDMAVTAHYVADKPADDPVDDPVDDPTDEDPVQFPPASYTLTVNSTGDNRVGVDITSNTGHGGKTNYQVANIDLQAQVHLEAPEYLGSGAERKSFSSWSGAISSSNRSINLVMDGEKAVTAHYVADPEVIEEPDDPVEPPEKYTLSVKSPADDPSMKIGVNITSKTGHGGRTPYTITGIEQGTEVHLQAPADIEQIESYFTGWSGAVSDTNRSITFIMDANKSVTVEYWFELF